MSTTLNHDHHDDEQNAPDVRQLDHPVLYWVWVDADDREVSPRWQAPQDANEFSVTGARLVARGQHPIPTSNRIDDVLVSADDAFWQEVAQAFPEAEFGDFSPEQTIAWEAAARAAIEGWVANNVPQTTTERTEA